MTEAVDLADLFAYQAKEPQQALDAAVAAVRAYCDWVIAPSTQEEATVWPADGRTVFVPTLNLTAVATVEQDSESFTDFTFDTTGTIILNSGCFSRLTQVTVEFTHGYTTMPDDVKAVVLGFAQRAISDSRGLVTKQSATGASAASLVETYGPVFSDTDKEKLAPYVLMGGFA